MGFVNNLLGGRGLCRPSHPDQLLLLACYASNNTWETDFYPVLVLGGVALSLRGRQTPAQYWIKIMHPWVQKIYPVLGLGSLGMLLRQFHTPILYKFLSVNTSVKSSAFKAAKRKIPKHTQNPQTPQNPKEIQGQFNTPP